MLHTPTATACLPLYTTNHSALNQNPTLLSTTTSSPSCFMLAANALSTSLMGALQDQSVPYTLRKYQLVSGVKTRPAEKVEPSNVNS